MRLTFSKDEIILLSAIGAAILKEIESSIAKGERRGKDSADTLKTLAIVYGLNAKLTNAVVKLDEDEQKRD